MNQLLIAAIFFAFANTVFASSSGMECSNFENTIYIDFYKKSVSVLVGIMPQLTHEKISFDDLELSETLIQKMPTQTRGQTSRTISFKEIKFKKRDGSEMPHAYNRLAEHDGTLNDYFVCSTWSVWL